MRLNKILTITKLNIHQPDKEKLLKRLKLVLKLTQPVCPYVNPLNADKILKIISKTIERN